MFLMMYSAYKLNKQGDSIQPWCTPYPIWSQSAVPCPVLTVAGVHAFWAWNCLPYLLTAMCVLLFSGSPLCLRNQAKEKSSLNCFQIQPFKAAFITKLKTCKINLEINSISRAIFSECAFTFNREKRQLCEQNPVTTQTFFVFLNWQSKV